MPINALIAQGIDPIGRDVPQIAQMLSQQRQIEGENKRRNALLSLEQDKAAQDQQDRASAQEQDSAKKAYLAFDYMESSPSPAAAAKELAAQYPEDAALLRQAGFDVNAADFNDEHALQLAKAGKQHFGRLAGIGPQKPERTSPSADMQAYAEWQKSNPGGNYEGFKKAMEAITYHPPQSSIDTENMDPTYIDTVAKFIASGSMPMLSGFVLKSPWGQAVVTRIAEMDPSYSFAEAPARAGTLKAFTSGVESRKMRSLNVAISHIHTLKNLSEALDNGDVQLINRAKQAASQQLGKPVPPAFDAVRQIVGAEIISAVVANQGSFQEREAAKDMVNKAQSPAQLALISKSWIELLAGQMGGLKTQYEEGVGKDIADKRPFASYLRPQTIQAMKDVNQWSEAPAVEPSAESASSGPQIGEVRKGYKFKGGDPALQSNWEKQ